MSYRVKVGPGIPEVVDETGNSVPNARVRRITFPSESETIVGVTKNYISGRGRAEIDVDGQEYRDVELCS